ncbi:MAG: molybdopterin-dependent oxidoreductase [Acidobacteria bacterium]|nr:molybdopterin-dependent oxidoreductase [Acidobacteriota bacterium]
MGKTESSIAAKLDRRDFMKFVGGGLVIFFTVESPAEAAQGARPKGFGFGGPGGGAPPDVNAYLRIGEDGKITVFTGKIEQGQGNMTALAQMAADELDVPLESVHMIMGDTDLCPWDMGTFGSMSIRIFGPALRSAAAEARAVLLEMAAEQLKVDKGRLKIEKGVIYSGSDRQSRVTYAQLTKGQKITRKLEQKPAPKPVSQFTLIGQSPVRVDAIEKVTGKARFTGDLRFPGLMYAKVLRPPAHGATLKSADTSEADKYPGATVINQDGLIAVLHEDPEAAEKALDTIKAEFDVPESTLDENNIFEHLVKVAAKPQELERKGDLAAGEKASATLFEAEYLNGYGAHASIETHTAVAKMEGGKLTVWISTQTPFPAQQEIARTLGMQPDKVRVITPYVGGGFGGKSTGLQALEAARLAKITGKPVQVSYNRAEEFFYDSFRPAAIVRIKSGVDANGKMCLWDYHVYYAGSRAAEQFYDVPHNLMRTYGSWMGGGATKAHPFATGAWRAPGANINVFARESQIDIMAARLKVDPLEFRLKNCSDARMRRVLEAAAERFGYKPAVGPSGRGIGIACGIDAESYVAEIAEISVDKGNDIKVRRIVAAQDMGVAVNPTGAIMQMEGCIMMGLGYTLSEDIRFKGGKILTANFDDYSVPKFSNLPEIDAFLVRNDDLPPKGGGEPAIVPVGGAIANALFDAIGVRVFQMPLTPERIARAAKNA